MSEQIEKLDIEKFNPTVAELNKMVAASKEITLTEFADKGQLTVVKNQRIVLRDVRISITKLGKKLRQEAVDFQKAVIAREKELIAIIEPEEERLTAIEEQADAFTEREKSRELLPKRLDRLAALKDGVEISEEEILNMDSMEFEGYYNKRFTDKNEKDRITNEAKERVLKEAEDKVTREKEIKEAEDRARAEERKRAEEAEANLKIERERAEKESKERIVREEREAKERVEKIEREAKEKVEREERERKEKAEAEVKAEAERKEKLAKDKEYLEFLALHGHNAQTHQDFYIKQEGSQITLYKKVGEITL